MVKGALTLAATPVGALGRSRAVASGSTTDPRQYHKGYGATRGGCTSMHCEIKHQSRDSRTKCTAKGPDSALHSLVPASLTGRTIHQVSTGHCVARAEADSKHLLGCVLCGQNRPSGAGRDLSTETCIANA
eukprot:2920702-Rhodomonas_salina.4